MPTTKEEEQTMRVAIRSCMQAGLFESWVAARKQFQSHTACNASFQRQTIL